ncbi:hypothetical protein C0993_011924 [Termitomyces sp. T159_Od127]|nr:hypothetical protein C0993_011924 [Termitomyces sp. T159_Od127]
MTVFVPNGLLGLGKPASPLGTSKDPNEAPMLAQSEALESDGENATIGTRLDSASGARLKDPSVKSLTWFTRRFHGLASIRHKWLALELVAQTRGKSF